MKEPILPFFRPLEKIEKVSDFYNNGHKNIRYCYRKGGGVQVEVAWCFSFVIMTLNIKCMDRAICNNSVYRWFGFCYCFLSRSYNNIYGILCFYNSLTSVFFFKSLMEQLVFGSK